MLCLDGLRFGELRAVGKPIPREGYLDLSRYQLLSEALVQRAIMALVVWVLKYVSAYFRS